MRPDMNAFSFLSLPCTLQIDEAQLRESYRKASKDGQQRQASETEMAELTAAYQKLRSSASLLRHWLELSGQHGEIRGTIDGELLDWFGQIGELLQQTDHLLRRREQCQSALAKAMMETEMQAGRLRIEEWQMRLKNWLGDKIKWFPAIEAGTVPSAEAWTLVRDLTFIEKWQQQLRERYGKFFF